MADLTRPVDLESGVLIHNPMRVVPREGGRSEIMFTLFRRPGVSDEEFEADARAVQRDLYALRDVLENRTASR